MRSHRTPARSGLARTARHFLIFVPVLLIAALGAGPVAAAHVRVDPTTLTPPLKPFRVCYETGRWVYCDTSNTDTWANEPVIELPCGTVYESATNVSLAERWYEDGLLVERNNEERLTGTWTLSPTGSGPSVEIRVNDGWHEHFVIPGDLFSDVERAHGSFLRILSFGNVILEVGLFLSPEEVHHGYSSLDGPSNIFDGTDPVGAAKLCDALAP
jgi:hypothetical protein